MAKSKDPDPQSGPVGNTDPKRRGRGVDRPSGGKPSGWPSGKRPGPGDVDGFSVGGRDKK
jgi:hypothetical protein